ncbi:NADP-specific glutamate dehydrogenase [Botrimarina sp.]|uniref:NADP-specific glutamate dehydrogenase n=1 Tax=Botrimarina sp. TaxID=2795802 RepID=UPI0032EAFD58
MPPSDADNPLECFMAGLRKRNPGEDAFHQAVEEVARDVMPWYLEHDELRQAQVLERLTEPDRIISFRVTWETDSGEVRSDRAWRVQFSNTLGPYKGGLRFDKSVTQGVLKFLGFEQVFKNALTGLPMGGAKGGSNFNPRGKSDREVMRFCKSLMTELRRHIGEHVDVPAGDIGVGRREIGYLFGEYVRLENRWGGVLTGKDEHNGGSAIRTEATGYGCVYFAAEVLQHAGGSIEGKRVAISGAGNVASFAAEKAIQMGARVVTMSDSDGVAVFDDGMTEEHLADLREVKNKENGRVSDFAEGRSGVEYRGGEKPWRVACDVAMPCATQNELDDDDAQRLLEGGLALVCEGSNMPLTAGAARHVRDARVPHAPGKASNAGGVAVSGLEMTQNAMRLSWSREEVDERLRKIMREIHGQCVAEGEHEGRVDYVRGANLAAFKKVAQSTLERGVV